VCKDCYNLSRRNKTVERSEDFALILAEVSEIRGLVVDLRNVNAGLRTENCAFKELLRPSLDDSRFAEMQAEINEVRSENKGLREMLHSLSAEMDDRYSGLGRAQVGVKDLCDKYKELDKMLHASIKLDNDDDAAVVHSEEINDLWREVNGLREFIYKLNTSKLDRPSNQNLEFPREARDDVAD